MTILIDTSVVLALYDRSDDDHARAVAFQDSLDEDVITTPLMVAEMDHLVGQRAGPEVVQALWGDLDGGAIQVRWWASALRETIALARERPRLGLADASLLALAPVVRTTRIATFDRRDFAPARTADGSPYTLLP